MGFNNGYDAGWTDAIAAAMNGRVAGLGPASSGSSASTAPAFDAGLLEGYDVEKLLSPTDRDSYLASLSDAELVSLVSTTSAPLNKRYRSYRSTQVSDAKLCLLMDAVIGALDSRGLIEAEDQGE